MGPINLAVALADNTRRIDALVIPPLGPDQILLDNDVDISFWCCTRLEKAAINFSSSTVSIPGNHRPSDYRPDPILSTVSPSVAAGHKDAKIHALKLRNHIN